jgi:hypothetical protein
MKDDEIISDTTLHDVDVNVQLLLGYGGGTYGYYFKIGDLKLNFASAERVCDLLRTEMTRARAAIARKDAQKI